MPVALLVSPHLDDVAFSCGGLAALLADRGWRTVLATAFTAGPHPAQGFALACQLDKGLSPEIDYMALRREEDRDAAAHLGIGELRWLGLPEAPNRGYGSAAALFAQLRPEDEAWRDLGNRLAALEAEFRPALVLAPQGLGGHVDHRQTIRAVRASVRAPVAWYRDTPYAIRAPEALPDATLGDGLAEAAIDIAPALARKLDAACAYRSQVGFQFGGAEAARRALRDFAGREGGERFLTAHPALLRNAAAPETIG